MTREELLLKELYPPFSNLVTQLLFQARFHSLPVGIMEGLRTNERQASLYALGRDKDGNVIDKSKVVTYARPGFSMHNFGLAVDIVFDANPGRPGFQWTWDPSQQWGVLAVMSRDLGLDCGYFWHGKIGNDNPHHQKDYGFTMKTLRELHVKGGLKEVWDNIDRSRPSGV